MEKKYSTDEEIRNLLKEFSDESDEGNDINETEGFGYDSDDDPEYSPSDEEVEASEIIATPSVLDRDESEKIFETIKAIEEREETQRPKKTKTCQSHDINRSLIINEEGGVLHGKNGYEWSTQPPERVCNKVPERNVVHVSPGPKPLARYAKTPLDAFKLFFTSDLMEKIVIHTNEEIASQRKNYNCIDGTLEDLTLEELDAFFGLNLLSAALKNNHLNASMLFDTSYSGNRFKATMSERRFRFLTNCLRFDDKLSREERKNKSRFAPILEIWELLMDNCEKNYKAGSYVTIDEQLLGFRGKCQFRIYIPSKPDRYGIKIFMIVDNGTKYMLGAMPYLGKGIVPGRQPAAEYFTQMLIKSVKGSNRNVTMNNRFSSLPLANQLLQKKLTVVGTIRKNKKELPKEFVDIKFQNRKTGSSFFIFHKEITAVSYKPRDNKLITLISTMHSDISINASSKKPEIIHSYNVTKGGVECFDQMCKNMNCARKTKRWPMAVFYGMMNIAAINSYIIYCHNYHRTSLSGKKALTRLQFLLQLHKELVTSLQRQRLGNTRLHTDTRRIINEALGVEQPFLKDPLPSQQGPRKYCSFCPPSIKRMTTTYCDCGKPVCREHQKKVCPKC